MGGQDSADVYFDDGDVIFVPPYLQSINLVYPNVRVVSDSNTTTAQDFIQRLRSGHYQLMAVAAHGGSSWIQFSENNGTQIGYVLQESIPSINAKTLFYMIHSCYTGMPGGFAEKLVFCSKGLNAIAYDCEAPGPVPWTFGEVLKRQKNSHILWPLIYNSDYAIRDIGFGTSRPLIPQQQPGIDINSTHSITSLMLKVHPNPANRLITIRYALSVKGQVSLQLFDISGRLVKTLVNEQKNIGNYSLIWNGTDDTNRKVGEGLYFCILKTDEKCLKQKILVIK
jgi:hypothetical protein